MSRIDRPALRGTLLGGVIRAWNPVYSAMLRSPLHWPWSTIAIVIEFSGRRTGRSYRTPVHYVEDGERLLLTSGDRWCVNLRGGAPVAVWLRGRRRAATGRVVDDESESIRLHQRMITQRPLFGWLMGLRRPGTDEQLVRSIRAGRKAIVIELDERP
jgi:deazaflavin-dependent oxidoreductase (nitroreductase family)